MRVLWVTNTIFPAPSLELGLSVPVEGGWMYGLAEQLCKQPTLQLAVAAVGPVRHMKKIVVGLITYYVIPGRLNLLDQSALEPFWNQVCNDFGPDIIHLHGTEFSHGLACIHSSPDRRYVVSLQGLVSVIARYYYAGISAFDIIANITFRDLVRMDTIFQAKSKFTKRGVVEKKILSVVENVIGRTRWDRDHAYCLNRNLNYYQCGEVIRASFYMGPRWSLQRASKNTIFLSQGSYPLKGLHIVLQAVKIIKMEFPDINLRVAGEKPFTESNFLSRFRMNGYGKYLRRQLRTLDLKENVVFTGRITEQEMVNEYLSARVFVCPSSIENSPNSVAEAQILGVPVIGAFVGGVPDMISDGVTGLLYRFEEVEMLASALRSIFFDDDLCSRLSNSAISAAQKRHNPDKIRERMVAIYQQVLK